MVRESRVCDAGTEIVSGRRKARAARDKLNSCHVIDSLAVPDKKQPHPAAWEREKWVFSCRSCLMMLKEGS
jgi:hypothetical protein